MADGTHIEWTDATWNPITGCSIVSPGCTNCYAMKLAGTRLAHHWSRKGLTRDSKAGPVWTGEVRFNEEWLDQPLRWRKPRMIFVCAHGDLFAEGVPDEWIDKVFAVMALAHWHTFQVLTKRPERMREYLRGEWQWRILDVMPKVDLHHKPGHGAMLSTVGGNLPNVWAGVSVEDQVRADERLPVLINTPAAVRWFSAEPLLGELDIRIYLPEMDWVVAGGESGDGSRPMHPAWARSLRDQCAAAGVAFLFKQWGQFVTEDQSPEDIVLPGQSIGPWSGDETHVYRVGKKAAGRLLDGVQHDGYPEDRAP